MTFTERLLRTFVEDLAKRGTRHDLRPTMKFREDPTEVAEQYLEYIKSMDQFVKYSANILLNQIKHVDKEIEVRQEGEFVCRQCGEPRNFSKDMVLQPLCYGCSVSAGI